LGFSLQGFPLVTIGAPLGAHAFMPLPRRNCASPEGGAYDEVGFKAFFP
jgi:hypothetical protein